jgi:hypothetical protein
MEKIKVEIYWTDKNYCCGWSLKDFGAVVCSNNTLEGLKADFIGALKAQINDMVADGEDVLEWLASGDYEISFSLAVSALLRQAEQFTTMAAISRVTGINQKLLSNYASSVKTPRAPQRQRIIEGLHTIGREFLSVQ